MTALIDTTRRAALLVQRDELTPPCLAVVLVAPRGRLSECTLALESALSQGAVTLACEIPACDTGIVGDDDVALGAAIEAIATAVDRASRDYPGVPIVLVGHADAAVPAELYADLYPEELSGVVATKAGHQHAA